MVNIPKFIVVHCSDVSHQKIADQYDSINEYHKGLDFPRSSSGSYVGYHRLITGGKNYKAKEDSEVGAHCNALVDGVSANQQSLGVCVGFDGDVEYPTAADYQLLKAQIRDWQIKYDIPDGRVVFHRDFTPTKTCPGSLLTRKWLDGLLAPDADTAKPQDQCEKQAGIMQNQKEQLDLYARVVAAYQAFFKLKK